MAKGEAVGCVLCLVVGILVGWFIRDARQESPAPSAPVEVKVERRGPGEKPRVARYPVAGGALYFVEGQEGLVFVPEVPK